MEETSGRVREMRGHYLKFLVDHLQHPNLASDVVQFCLTLDECTGCLFISMLQLDPKLGEALRETHVNFDLCDPFVSQFESARQIVPEVWLYSQRCASA